MIEYWIGVDGGGTGTRVALARPGGALLGLGQAGPSALGQGTAQAWTHIVQATVAAFSDAHLPVPAWSVCAMGAGLSGVNHRPWSDEFLALDPGFAHITAESDAYTMLLGAHAGQPGAMVAAGTGSVGEVLRPDGSRFQVSGWGFPGGDEGSGAWLGLRAMALAQQALDHRTPSGPLAQRILAHCGGHRTRLLAWCAAARQFEYAQLAPYVFEAAPSDPAADKLLSQAADALHAMALALDPDQTLPLAVCGSIGKQLHHRLPADVRARCVEPQFDATYGALLLNQTLKHPPSRGTPG